MINKLRIGIPIIGSKEWMGGITYIEILIKALNSLEQSERPQVYLLAPEHIIYEFDSHNDLLSMVDGLYIVGTDCRKSLYTTDSPFIKYCSENDLPGLIDFYFPATYRVEYRICSGSWIPDFQHIILPEFFSKQELLNRDNIFRNIADKAKLVVFSSRDAENHFRTNFPSSRSQTRILSFHSLPLEQWYSADASQIQKKYNLPDKYLICCNQFWAHKNHAVLFRAIAKLISAGQIIHLVCTGLTSDYRNPSYFSELQGLMDNEGISNYIRILGVIPRQDQIQLIRRSMAVVQPSLFEGWSTVVEDSRSLGKTIFLSDLDVHMEQSPDNAVFFQRHDFEDLAYKITDILPHLFPGPDIHREQIAKEKTKIMVRDYANKFCRLALEAQSICGMGSDRSLIEKGEYFFINDDYDGAISFFLQAIEKNQESHVAHNNLAIIYWQKDDKKRAFDHLRLALSKNPLFKPAILNYSEILLQSGNGQKALVFCQEYMKHFPDDEEIRTLLKLIES